MMVVWVGRSLDVHPRGCVSVVGHPCVVRMTLKTPPHLPSDAMCACILTTFQLFSMNNLNNPLEMGVFRKRNIKMKELRLYF